ncbi:MAG: N-acetylglucosamine-6-phosphate deacetylase [Clostridia bacterium]|nr:N-acetylglucosamine-6-phosphate deacetylase [Clostridia bacterium]
MKTLIKNARVVTKENIIENGYCIVENGLISSLGSGHVSLLEDYKEIDANGNYLIPGFVDLHCHGGNGYDFMDGTIKSNEEISSFHLLHGTTTLFLTTLCADKITTKKAFETCKEFLKKSQKTNVAGVHLEGPCLNPVQCGAQKVADMVHPLEFNLEELVAEYPFIKRISIAPELDGANDLARKGKTLGLVLSIAHTDGDFNDVKNAIDNGYTLATHLYSGMNGVTRKNAFRKAGVVEGALYFDDMYVELIADGRHLPKELLQYVYKIKGADKICLVTDATRPAGLPNGAKSVIGSLDNGQEIIVENDVAFLPDKQSFAGSTATFNRLYRTMAGAIGKNMVALSKMCSTTPAKVMGYTDRGEIAQGKLADLIIMDDDLNIKQIIFKGECL